MYDPRIPKRMARENKRFAQDGFSREVQADGGGIAGGGGETPLRRVSNTVAIICIIYVRLTIYSHTKSNWSGHENRG